MLSQTACCRGPQALAIALRAAEQLLHFTEKSRKMLSDRLPHNVDVHYVLAVDDDVSETNDALVV